jgi:5-methylcytosine-specific restriction endonuclease McrA
MLNPSEIKLLTLINPPYQADLNLQKVNDMIDSYHANKEYGRFKNIIVIAVRMVGTKTLYLVDGQHRVEMLKQINVDYPFRVIFYAIQSDDEMRQLFKEMNYDSHKNMAYVSLGADKAKIADDLANHYKDNKLFKKKNTSKLYTLRTFIDAISDYVQTFDDVKSLLQDIEFKQTEFISKVDFSRHYVEESECITNNFILPLMACNFVTYLQDSNTQPEYRGKNNPAPRTITHTTRMQVWETHYGMGMGEAICPVCKIVKIYQMSFHCGHINPRSKGGLNHKDNLRPLCQSCNSSMGNTHFDEYMLTH